MKVLDDNVFSIIKSRCIFLFFCVIIWSLLGVKKRLCHAQIGLFPTGILPLFIWESSPPGAVEVQYSTPVLSILT